MVDGSEETAPALPLLHFSAAGLLVGVLKNSPEAQLSAAVCGLKHNLAGFKA
jgi:hypothetical protein